MANPSQDAGGPELLSFEWPPGGIAKVGLEASFGANMGSACAGSHLIRICLLPVLFPRRYCLKILSLRKFGLARDLFGTFYQKYLSHIRHSSLMLGSLC